MKPVCRIAVPVLLALCFLTWEGCTPSFREVRLSEANRILVGDGSASDYFGFAVAIGADRAVVGAPGVRDNGPESGAAYIFKHTKQGWVQEEKLEAGDAGEKDRFGIAVAVGTDRVVVGARGPLAGGMQSGAAYVFLRTGTGWMQEQKLKSEGRSANDRFGVAVAIDGDRIVVGAPGDVHDGARPGAAYVFRQTGTDWEREARLTPSDGTSREDFGAAVALSGDRILVGAPGADLHGRESGAAYVYAYTAAGWVQEARLTARDGRAHDLFGSAVAFDGTTAVLGARGNDARGRNAGAVYVFRKTGRGWEWEARLTALDGHADGDFGTAVALSGSRILAGARGDAPHGPNSGSAYLFRRTGRGWVQETKILAADAARNANFGASVSLFETHLIIGAYGHGGRGPWAGAAYVY